MTVEYMYREDLASICKALASNSYLQLNFDPLECIFGINLQASSSSISRDPRVQTS